MPFPSHNGSRIFVLQIISVHIYFVSNLCHFPSAFAIFFFFEKNPNGMEKEILPVADPRFPRGGGANSPGRGANMRFCQIFPKTAWNRKNLVPRGPAVPCAPRRSANDYCIKFFGSMGCPPLKIPIQSNVSKALRALNSNNFDVWNFEILSVFNGWIINLVYF